MLGTGMQVGVSGVHAAALAVGTSFATVLLLAAAWNLIRANIFVGVAATVLVLAVLAVSWSTALAVPPLIRAPVLRWPLRWAVLSSFPVALLGSILDCAGFGGCTELCGFLNTRWIPVLVVVTLWYLVRPRSLILCALTVASFVLLVPSCRCYNPVNRMWIDWMGLSPACFSGSFAVGIMTAGAIASRRLLLVAGVLGWLVAIALLSFHIAHHRFHWPW